MDCEGRLSRLGKRLIPDVPAAIAADPSAGRPFSGKLFVYVGFPAACAGRRSGSGLFDSHELTLLE